MIWLKYWYLRIAYFLGFKAHVYHQVSGLMANDEKDWLIRVHSEAWVYQQTLIDRGWFECPSCLWATKKPNEHIAKGEGYCYEQANNDNLYARAEEEYLHHGPNARPIQ